MLRAGLVGLGAMGRHHARVLSTLEGVSLVGGADPRGDPFTACRDIPVVPSVHDLLSLQVDYVVVATPTWEHGEVALTLAAEGVPTLVEKPLAMGVAEGEAVVRAFRQASTLCAVGHIERYNPALQQAKRRLDAGQIGDVYHLSTRRLSPFPSRISDVGVVMDLATHDIDLAMWLLGERYASVSAATRFKAEREFEDLLVANATMTDGTAVSQQVNWLSPVKERVTVITGERGMLLANTVTSELTFYANGNGEFDWETNTAFGGVLEGDVTRYSFEKTEPLRAEHERFRDAVLGESDQIATADEALEVVRVAAAMLESAQTGETVRILAAE